MLGSLENRVQFLLPGTFYASFIFGKTHLQIAKTEIGIEIEIEFMHLNFSLALFFLFYCYFPEIIN